MTATPRLLTRTPDHADVVSVQSAYGDAGFRAVGNHEQVDRPTLQRASLSIEPSEYGFAVVYRLDGGEPSVLLHRQQEQRALVELGLHTKLLVDFHGWEVLGAEGYTTHLTRLRPLDADEPGC